MSDWQDTLSYALTMSRASGLRYRISAFFWPGKGWRYCAYPAINSPKGRGLK